MKIFCIGFQKTGTSSLGKALEILGYSVTGAHGTRDPDISRTVYQLADTYLPLYDAFQDNPWPVLYEYLDRTCPDSKFILTTRDPASWVKSIVSHCGRRSTPMREWIYGYGNPLGHEIEYRERYVRHNNEVRDYFAQRDGVLLQMDLREGDGWQELCPFLRVPLPDGVPFPHRNRAVDRKPTNRWRAAITSRLKGNRSK